MAAYKEVSKCSNCKEKTISAASWNTLCTSCRVSDELKLAGARITGIRHYLMSGNAISDVKSFAAWKSKKKNVEVSFYHQSEKDPVAQSGIGDNTHILCLPSDLGGGGQSIVMVGRTDKGWWFRRGRWHKDKTDDNNESIHEICLHSPLDDYDMRLVHRMDEALFLAIVKETKPIITL